MTPDDRMIHEPPRTAPAPEAPEFVMTERPCPNPPLRPDPGAN